MPLMINGQRVDESALAAEFGNIKSYFERMGNISCCERDDEFRGYARQNIIARVLLSQRALASTAKPTEEEVNAALEKLKAEHGGEGRFLAAVGAAPDQMDLVRQDIELNLRMERMIEGLCRDQAAPSEETMREFYRTQIASFMTAEEVRASHISKAPPRGEQRQEVYETFREVRRKLLEGADFDELAREHSDRGKEQIDLGFFRRGELPEEFEMVAFSMKVGEISPVFMSAVGFHILKVTGVKPSVAKPFEEVREEVRRALVEQGRQERVAELVKEMEGEARIEEVEEAKEVV